MELAYILKKQEQIIKQRIINFEKKNLFITQNKMCIHVLLEINYTFLKIPPKTEQNIEDISAQIVIPVNTKRNVLLSLVDVQCNVGNMKIF